MTRLPLLMLPGHMCDRRLWLMVEPGLRASGRELVHGDITGASSVPAIAEQILAAAPPRFVVMGLSMGGIVAFEIMRQQPDRVAGLILSDTNAAPEPPERETMRRAQQRKVRDGGLAAVVRDELKPAYVAPANRNRRDILGLAFAMAIDLGPEVFLRQSEALITRPDARPGLRAIDCPTMILCGAEDPVCPPAWHRELAARIRGAELQLISGAGHLPPLEQPRRFTDAVTHWLSRVEKEHEWAAAAIEF